MFGDRTSSYCNAVKNDTIKFHYEIADDPDWILKKVCLFLIAETTEIEKFVDNL